MPRGHGARPHRLHPHLNEGYTAMPLGKTIHSSRGKPFHGQRLERQFVDMHANHGPHPPGAQVAQQHGSVPSQEVFVQGHPLPTSPRWAAIRHFVSSALTIMVILLLVWTYVGHLLPPFHVTKYSEIEHHLHIGSAGRRSSWACCWLYKVGSGTKISPWRLFGAMDWAPVNANLATSKQPMYIDTPQWVWVHPPNAKKISAVAPPQKPPAKGTTGGSNRIPPSGNPLLLDWRHLALRSLWKQQ